MRVKSVGAVAVSLLIIAGLAAGACGDSGEVTPASGSQSTTTPLPPRHISAFSAPFDLAVGANRFSFALVDEDSRPIVDAQVHVRFGLIGADDTQIRSEADAVFRGQGLEDIELPISRGLWVVKVEFDSPGFWVAEVNVSEEGKPLRIASLAFEVRNESIAPAIGSPAISSENKTLADVGDIKELTTDSDPDPDLHRISIAEALQQGRPFIVVFATPAFCESRTCGPLVEVVKQIKEEYGDRMNYIHIEIYDDPIGLLQGSENLTLRPAVTQWNIPTEPWVFFVDGQGIIADRFEGFASYEELKEAAEKLVGPS
ncbi:MAG: thioredoxin family protein [Dehalococcoidia bacterium]